MSDNITDSELPEKIRICVLSGDKNQDSFMHSVDVFENSKRLATPAFFTVRPNSPDADQSKIVNVFRKAAEKEGQYVVAVFIVGFPDSAFIDSTVKSISDGKKWGLLSQFLEAYGIAK